MVFISASSSAVNISRAIIDYAATGVDKSVSFELSWEGNRKTALVSASLDRPSLFDVQIFGSHGILEIPGSGACPTAAFVRVYGDAEQCLTGRGTSKPQPCCQQTLSRMDYIQASLPKTDSTKRFYPCTSGFLYIIYAIEDCLAAAKIGKTSFSGWTEELSDFDQVFVIIIYCI
jgi:hypothetical protein